MRLGSGLGSGLGLRVGRQPYNVYVALRDSAVLVEAQPAFEVMLRTRSGSKS